MDQRTPARRDGFPRLRFRFGVTVATRDRRILAALQTFLGAGSLNDYPPRKEGWQPLSVLTIASVRAHLSATIPFADAFLPDSAKRRQFVAWRDRLIDHEAVRPRRARSVCSEPVHGSHRTASSLHLRGGAGSD